MQTEAWKSLSRHQKLVATKALHDALEARKLSALAGQLQGRGMRDGPSPLEATAADLEAKCGPDGQTGKRKRAAHSAGDSAGAAPTASPPVKQAKPTTPAVAGSSSGSQPKPASSSSPSDPLPAIGRVVSSIMHGMGDAACPSAKCVAVVARDCLAYTRSVLACLRLVMGRDAVRVGDFAVQMPETTRVYFRWKTLKGMTGSGPAAAGGGDGSGGDVAGAAAPGAVDDVDAMADEDAEEAGGASLSDSGGGGDDEGGDATPVAAATITAEDEEECRQLAVLQAAAEEEMRTGRHVALPASMLVLGEQKQGHVSAGGSDAGGADVPPNADSTTPDNAVSATAAPVANDANNDADDDDGPAMRTFRSRLHFFNLRSAGMTTTQYAAYARAREQGFVSRSQRTTAAFAAAVVAGDGTGVGGRPASSSSPAAAAAGSAISRTTLEVLSYLCYDRAGCAVEAALRLLKQQQQGQQHQLEPESATPTAATTSSADPSASPLLILDLDRPIPLAVYQAAIPALPPLPVELSSKVADITAAANKRAQGDQLKQARDADRLAAAAGDAAAAVAASRWAGGTRDVQGDQAFLQALQLQQTAATTTVSVSNPSDVLGAIAAAVTPLTDGLALTGGQAAQPSTAAAPASSSPAPHRLASSSRLKSLTFGK